jgi:diketogulonate reductase-like aldo/keto reductase
MEELVDEGKLRAIGMSNFSIHHLEDILAQCRIKPAVNQVECHPCLNQSKMLEFCHAHGIRLMGFSPLGRAGDKDNKVQILRDPVMIRIAEKHGASPVHVALKWQIQRGVAVIPKTATPERLKQNIMTGDLQLDEKDMAAITSLHTGQRLICPPFMKYD